MISGTGRSGTNITKAIFARHSKVATLPFEYRVVVDPGGIIDFFHGITNAWSPYAADKKIRELKHFLLSKATLDEIVHAEGLKIKETDPTGRKTAPPSYHGWELEKWIPGYTGIVKELIDQLTVFSFNGCWPGTDSFSENNRMYFSDFYNPEKLKPVLGNFINKLTQSILEHQMKEVLAEDNTWNILFADTLLNMLPNARLIHIIRDPRDVVASLVKQNWAPDDTKQAIRFYISIINRWFEVIQKLDPAAFIQIKLENLIENPEKEIRKMCLVSGIDFESEMLGVELLKSSIGRWKNEFTKSQIDDLNRLLKPAVTKLGYDV